MAVLDLVMRFFQFFSSLEPWNLATQILIWIVEAIIDLAV